jgi:hypothetical protein
VPWKCDADNEDKIKAETKATIRCYPFEHNLSPPTGLPPPPRALHVLGRRRDSSAAAHD